jgi:nucleoid-associated protein YgaU
MFFKGSRYAGVGDLEGVTPDGRTVRYKKVRLVPQVHSHMEHVVAEGERLDQIAHRYYRDPERFWRICDANRALWPDELTAAAGRAILIPPAEG